jgi:hypothetical protein
LVFVLVGIDIGDDPSYGAQDSIGRGCLRELTIVGCADVVSDCVGMTHVIDYVADGVD